MVKCVLCAAFSLKWLISSVSLFSISLQFDFFSSRKLYYYLVFNFSTFYFNEREQNLFRNCRFFSLVGVSILFNCSREMYAGQPRGSLHFNRFQYELRCREQCALYLIESENVNELERKCVKQEK